MDSILTDLEKYVVDVTKMKVIPEPTPEERPAIKQKEYKAHLDHLKRMIVNYYDFNIKQPLQLNVYLLTLEDRILLKHYFEKHGFLVTNINSSFTIFPKDRVVS